MAVVFLKPVAEGERLTKHHNKLRICFKDFLKKLASFSCMWHASRVINRSWMFYGAISVIYFVMAVLFLS